MTPARAAAGLLFTRHYLEIRETFVTAGEPVSDLADLAGRTVTVPRATSYPARLAAMRGNLDVEVSELSGPAILEAVAEGALDVTLVDSHHAELAATFDPRLTPGLALDPVMRLVWAVGPGRGDLKRELDAFLEAGYRGTEFNVLYNKYFVNRRRQAQQREHRITGSQLSEYDALVKPRAAAEGFDWRLIVAQMYQESGFDPARVSFAGARGLLQIMPRTAIEFGVDPARLADPEVGIDVGVRYLAWSRDRFPDLPPGEQLWFALASYNGGFGHVRDARHLARRLGLDGSRWFGHVEEAMLRLSEPRYAGQAAYGLRPGFRSDGVRAGHPEPVPRLCGPLPPTGVRRALTSARSAGLQTGIARAAGETPGLHFVAWRPRPREWRDDNCARLLRFRHLRFGSPQCGAMAPGVSRPAAAMPV